MITVSFLYFSTFSNMLTQSLLVALLATSSTALDVPQNVRNFYNQLKSKGQCDNKLATGFFNSEFEKGGALKYSLLPDSIHTLIAEQICPIAATISKIMVLYIFKVLESSPIWTPIAMASKEDPKMMEGATEAKT